MADTDGGDPASAQPSEAVDPRLGGPFYDDLRLGSTFDAPSLTLTDGFAALHQSVVGDRLPLPLSQPLSEAVMGPGAAMAHPALVWDVAIGQSTVATQRVKANLFYRDLTMYRAPRIGDTLTTATEVVGLRDNTPRAGRGPTGMVRLRLTTTDQDARPVLTVDRCAMLPMSSEASRPGHGDDVSGTTEAPVAGEQAEAATWDPSPLPEADVAVGDHWTTVPGADRVLASPLLTRLTLNLAGTHSQAEDRALVYGGQVIGMAFAQLSRAIPGIVAVSRWHSCDHRAPVREGDVVTSAFRVEARAADQGRLRAYTLGVRSWTEGNDAKPVLDWRLDVLVR